MIPVLQPTFHPGHDDEAPFRVHSLLKQPHLGLTEEADAVNEVIRSGWWGEGPKVAEFEKAMAERYGRRHCIAVNSCTAALHLALLAHNVGPGDEVILPALTFVSTGLAVLYVGARPVFADVYPDTLTLDWANLKHLITPKTRAIMPVDYAGYPAVVHSQLPPRHDVPVIQDAAHSCGGLAYGDTVCLSFHPVKNLATPDGGAILTDDGAMADRLRALRWCGIDRSTWARTGKRYSWDYDIAEIGYKCHWNDVAAAIGLVQLKHLDELNARRRELAARYDEYLSPFVQVPPNHDRHMHHLYPIRVDADKRDALIDWLVPFGISAGVHYRPLYDYPIFPTHPSLPVTQREWKRLVSLPLYAHMTEAEQGTVIGAIRAFVESQC